MSPELVYLACPYTDPDVRLRVIRFQASARAAAHLIHQGMFVYSPITMTHPIDLVMAEEGGTMGSDYWVDFDEAFMCVCKEIIVLTIPGWRKSRGVARELEFFRGQGKLVRYLAPVGDGFNLTDQPQDEAD